MEKSKKKKIKKPYNLVQIPHLRVDPEWVEQLVTIHYEYRTNLDEAHIERESKMEDAINAAERYAVQHKINKEDHVKKVRKQEYLKIYQLAGRRTGLKILVSNPAEKIWLSNYLRNQEKFIEGGDFSFCSYIFGAIKCEYEYEEKNKTGTYFFVPFANDIKDLEIMATYVYIGYDPLLPMSTALQDVVADTINNTNRKNLLPLNEVIYQKYISQDVNYFLDKIKTVEVKWPMLDHAGSIFGVVDKSQLLKENGEDNWILLTLSESTQTMLEKYYGYNEVSQDSIVRVLRKNWDLHDKDDDRTIYRDLVCGEYATVYDADIEDGFMCYPLYLSEGKLVEGTLKKKRKSEMIHALDIEPAQVQRLAKYVSIGMKVIIYVEKGETLKFYDLYKLISLGSSIAILYVENLNITT